MNSWTPLEVEAWQNNKLKDLVSHAYLHTKFYKELFDRLNISPEDIISKDDLYKIPVLTKQDIINNYSSLVPNNIDTIRYKKASTGGSMGDPLKYLLDIESWSYFNANSIVHWERTAYKYGQKYVALGSTSLFVNKKASIKHRFYYKLKGKIGMNGINMSEEVCSEYVSFIKNNKIIFIYGYASSIYLLAKYVLDHHIQIKINSCFPTSEMLTDLYRDTIINAFNCDIVNCYGARDGGINAFEHKKGYFETGYNSLFVLEDKFQKNRGSLLVTDLLNKAMPLINYKLGDEVEIEVSDNKYIYNGQLIKRILGRSSDIIVLDNGHVLTGPGFTVLFSNIPIKAYKIKKLSNNELICEIIKNTDYTPEHEKIVLGSLKKHAGDNINIIINYKNSFELTSSGKRNYFYTEKR